MQTSNVRATPGRQMLPSTVHGLLYIVQLSCVSSYIATTVWLGHNCARASPLWLRHASLRQALSTTYSDRTCLRYTVQAASAAESYRLGRTRAARHGGVDDAVHHRQTASSGEPACSHIHRCCREVPPPIAHWKGPYRYPEWRVSVSQSSAQRLRPHHQGAALLVTCMGRPAPGTAHGAVSRRAKHCDSLQHTLAAACGAPSCL